MIRIPRLEDMPVAAQRADWAKILNCDESTLWRSQKTGLLVGTKGRTGQVLYTRDAILAWLGLEIVEVVPPPVTQVLPIAPRKQLVPAK